MWIFKSNPVAAIPSKIKAATQVNLASLCCFRVVFCLFTMIFSWPRYAWLGDVPDAFFDPPLLSLASLFKAFPPDPFFQSLDIAIGLCTLTLLLGLFTRLSTVLLLAMLVVGSSFQYSLGKIDHGDALYLSTLFAMCFQNWGAMVSVDALLQKSQQQKSQRQKPHPTDKTEPVSLKTINQQPKNPTEAAAKTADLSFFAVLIAFGFLTAGFGKALNWLDFDPTTSGFLSWFYGGYFNHGRDRLLAPLVLKINAPLIWELIDTSAVIFELGALLAILSRKHWYAWLTTACIFHLANCLLLNIDFEMNAIVYLAFVPWAQLPIVDRAFSRQQRFKWPLAGLATFSTVALIIRQHFPQTKLPLLEAVGIQDKLLVSCGIWAGALAIFLVSFSTFVRLPSQQEKREPSPKQQRMYQTMHHHRR